MAYNLNIWRRGTLIHTLKIQPNYAIPGQTFFSIRLEDIQTMPEQLEPTVARRRRNRVILDRIADPERGFPIIRSLIQKFAPMLIEFLITKLPIWLADVEDLDNDQPTA